MKADFFDINTAELKIDFRKNEGKPRFSVIIPTFNRKSSLKFVLNNFFKQDYPKSKYEVIVVDDGSSDRTFESIKRIKPTCNFKYLYWPRKKSKVKEEFKKFARFYNRVGPARNIGIKYAQGEIVLFNDADILVAQNCLKKHETYHNKYPNIIVRGFRMLLSQKPGKMSVPEKRMEERKENCRFYDLSKEGWHRLITSNLSLRKKYLEKVGGFSKDFVFWGGEDVDLGYRLRKLNLKFIWDDKIKIYHLYHPRESGSKAKDLLALKMVARILYNKYTDDDIIRIFTDVIRRRLNVIS